MSIEQKSIFQIKKHGHLIALSKSWQYWIYNDIIYSINVTGDHVNVWCGVSELPGHLVRLYQITGKRFFTEQTQVIDKSFIKKFIYA